MKKVILLTVVLSVILSGFVAFAEPDEQYGVLDGKKLAETYINDSVNLFGTGKTLEETLVEGWSNLSSEIRVANYNIPVSELGSMYWGTLYDNPKIYFVDSGCRYKYNASTGFVTAVIPEYTVTDRNTINQTIKDIDEATEEIMLCLDEKMTDFEKIMAVHDYMVLHYEYDYTLSNHTITIMTTKTGVCMSYALAFKHIMKELGIDCLYISSDPMDHAWNLVKIDGEWYHIDLTWDDPGAYYGQTRHEYALLSDYEIQHLDKPHYSYDSKGQQASSNRYDKAHWHEGVGAVATIGNRYYFVDGNNLVDQDGEVIYEGLDGKDGGWLIGNGYYFANSNYTGLAEYNGQLYFNTDKAVYSYNPLKKETVKVIDCEGICGLFVDRNTLKYCKFNIESNEFVEAGQYSLGKIRFGGTFHKDNKIIKRICKEQSAEDVCILADCGDCVEMQVVTDSGVSKISFDSKDCQTLYYWNSHMKPLKEKEIYKN